MGVLVEIVIHLIDGRVGQLLLLRRFGRHDCGSGWGGVVEVEEDFSTALDIVCWCMSNDSRLVATVWMEGWLQGRVSGMWMWMGMWM